MLKPITQKLKIKNAILDNALTEEAKNGLNKIKEIEETVEREKSYYRRNEYKYNLQNFRTINTIGRDIYNDNITLKEVNKD